MKKTTPKTPPAVFLPSLLAFLPILSPSSRGYWSSNPITTRTSVPWTSQTCPRTTWNTGTATCCLAPASGGVAGGADLALLRTLFVFCYFVFYFFCLVFSIMAHVSSCCVCFGVLLALVGFQYKMLCFSFQDTPITFRAIQWVCYLFYVFLLKLHKLPRLFW